MCARCETVHLTINPNVRLWQILLQKSKVTGLRIFRGKQSPIRITSVALSKSPVSLAWGHEVPHILTRKSRLQGAEFLITSAKRVLQHNRHIPSIRTSFASRAKRTLSACRKRIYEYAPWCRSILSPAASFLVVRFKKSAQVQLRPWCAVSHKNGIGDS
jgi:hypothetical protein